MIQYTKQEWFTPAEVAIHNKPSDCWVSLQGKVYDLSSWLQEQFHVCHCTKNCSCQSKTWYCDDDCVEYCPCFKRGFLYCDGKRLAMTIIAYAGKDVSHWFKASEWLRYTHPTLGSTSIYQQHGHSTKQPVVPSTRWRPVEQPWWLNEGAVVGKATAKTRPIRITNTLTSSTVTLEVCSEETLNQVKVRYLPHNSHMMSYSWLYLGRLLCSNKTLAENGIPDERDRFSDVALPENMHIPAILLYFNDDLTEDNSTIMATLPIFVSLSSEGLFTCPVNASPVDYAKIYPDPESEKAIMGSVVYCIHHKEGCQWSDELRKLKAHLNTCKHDAVLCAAQCGAMIPRVLMQDHLRYTCPRRRANCDHCHKEFSGSALEEHQGNCGHEPVYCENKCGAKVQRRHTQQHIQQHCSKRLVPCRHCAQRYTQDTVAAHGATCARAPVACPQRCGAGAVPRDELDAHLRDHCAAAGVPCAFRDAGCRFKGTRQALERHTEESCQQHLALVSALASRQARQLDSLRAAVARLSVNCSGALVWRITDWAAKMAEAKCKDGVELVSPAFYTSQYGYKLQASLFLNGNGAGEATHMSVYIKILPGEYDALLRWPFAHTVSFTLFDQSSSPDRACNIVESFVPDPTWKNFQRPSKEPDALGFGFPRFVSHEMLKKRNFVKDDVMFLRVKVDPSKIVAV